MYSSCSGIKSNIFQEFLFFFENFDFSIEGSPLWIFLAAFDIFHTFFFSKNDFSVTCLTLKETKSSNFEMADDV
jgi:hypothetical protein